MWYVRALDEVLGIACKEPPFNFAFGLHRPVRRAPVATSSVYACKPFILRLLTIQAEPESPHRDGYRSHPQPLPSHTVFFEP